SQDVIPIFPAARASCRALTPSPAIPIFRPMPPDRPSGMAGRAEPPTHMTQGEGGNVKVGSPLAGEGTRLRPPAHGTPEQLVRVGDKPVMSYILDDLRDLGVNEAVFITGHLKERVEEYMAQEYADFDVRYVEQAVQNGTAGAVELARPYVDEDLLIIFVDTLF